jgi:Family of unknown function (DUF6496)
LTDTEVGWLNYAFSCIDFYGIGVQYADEELTMAKYGKAAGKSVKSAMHREKRGTLRSGKGGKGGRVTSRKQAIAIGLSEARKKGAKVPKKK